ncbi:MAG TPA: TIGR03013 family XrtA/PEP-CTERM system glycosyltransferase [Thermodesulfobacteriota bacterium]|nr:TIGR03013 family XrtA/PEP-CTERM system glycosyltransferase [Thermodesulfobacteriota bacterium]
MILRIFDQYTPVRKIAFFFLESVFIMAMVIAGTYLRFLGDTARFLAYEGLFFKALLIVGSAQLSLYYFDLYDLKIFRSNLELAIRLLQSLGVSSLLLAVLYYLFPFLIIGRGIFLISLGFIGAIIVSWRIIYNRILKTKQLDQKIMIIGSGPLAESIAKEIVERVDTGFKVIGFITDNPERVGEKLVNPSIMGDQSRILDMATREKVDRIIVALEERRGKFPDAQLLECKMRGIIVEDGIEFYEHLTGKLQVENLRPSSLIFSEGFKKSKLTMWMKRVSGFGLSLIGLILLSPLILIISILIKIDSPGPVFYRQERVGERGKTFKLLKFRSMVESAEANGPVWAGKNDGRITRIGGWIRKWRLDEIPQMFNVLKGDMSFVGPRPERAYFVEKLREEIPFYNQRFFVKPGITGLAQVRYQYGASKEDALEKLKYDLCYIKNLSSLFDLLIIFETIKVVLSGKGAR